jgi:uncharacterized protein (DUF58 family)
MIAPTPRAAALFALTVPLALVLVALDVQYAAAAVAGALLVLAGFVADALLAWPLRRLNVAVRPPERLFVGEAGRVAVDVGAARFSGRTALEILLDCRGELDPVDVQRVLLEPGSAVRGHIALTARRRGRIHLDALWFRWAGPLRLGRFIRRVPLDAVVDVVPNVHGSGGTDLRVLAEDALHGVKPQTQRGEGTEFDALRDYAPGHDLRQVDWKHSARHRKLLCKEFRTERNHHIVLAFDTGRLMREPIGGLSRLDHCVNAGLALAAIALRGGDLVGLYGFDAAVRAYLAPLRGMERFARLQRATADLGYEPEETNYTLGLAELSTRLRRRALVILFTEFADTITAELMIESLGRMANHHVVVLVTLRDRALERALDAEPTSVETVAGAVIAEHFRRDRSVVLERLSRLGLHCLDVAPGGVSVALVNRYLDIKARGLL